MSIIVPVNEDSNHVYDKTSDRNPDAVLTCFTRKSDEDEACSTDSPAEHGCFLNKTFQEFHVLLLAMGIDGPPVLMTDGLAAATALTVVAATTTRLSSTVMVLSSAT